MTEQGEGQAPAVEQTEGAPQQGQATPQGGDAVNPVEPTPESKEVGDKLKMDTPEQKAPPTPEGDRAAPPEGTKETPEKTEKSTEEPEKTTEKSTEEPEKAPEEKEEKTAKTLREWAKEHLTDNEFDDDSQVGEHLKEILDGHKQSKETIDKLNEIFFSDPEMADLAYLMSQGATRKEAMEFIDGDTDMDMDEAKEGWQKAAKEMKATKAERENKMKEIQQNWDMSLKEINEFAKENNMSEDQAGEFLTQIDELMENVVNGKIGKQTLQKLHTALSHEEKVKEASETAEVKGRNEAIDEIKNKKAEKKGDGLPHPKSASTETPDRASDNSPEARIARNIDNWANRPF